MPGFADAASFHRRLRQPGAPGEPVKPEAELVVTVTGVVETIDRNGVLGRLPGDPPAPRCSPPTDGADQADRGHHRKFRSMRRRDGQGRIALLHALMARVGEVLDGGEQSQSQDGQSQSQSQAAQSQGRGRTSPMPSSARRGRWKSRRAMSAAISTPTKRRRRCMPGPKPGTMGWAGSGSTRCCDICPTDRHVRRSHWGSMPVVSAQCRCARSPAGRPPPAAVRRADRAAAPRETRR